MKSKILILIIGILIGAIMATTGFLIYNKSVSNKNSNQTEMIGPNGNGQMGEPPSNGNMGEPPAKPDGDNGEEPPARPENSNNNSNS